MTTFNDLTNLPPEDRWRGQTHPVPVVLALIKETGRFLLIKRNSPPYKELWALVGGKWDFGEPFADALLREVAEETGLAGHFVAWRGFVNERVKPAGEPAGAHFYLFVAEVTPLPNQTASEQREGAVAWFTADEIDVLHEADQIIPSDYLMIKQFGNSTVRLPFAEVDMTTDANYDRASLSDYREHR